MTRVTRPVADLSRNQPPLADPNTRASLVRIPLRAQVYKSAFLVFLLFYVGRRLVRGRSPVQGALQNVWKIHTIIFFGVRVYRRDMDLLTTCIRHFTVHWHTRTCVPSLLTASTSRFLAVHLTAWSFYSFRGHTVARWLTLNNRNS